MPPRRDPVRAFGGGAPAARGPATHTLAPAQPWATNVRAFATEMKFFALCQFFKACKAKRQGLRRAAVRRFLEMGVTGRRFDDEGTYVGGGPAETTPPDRLGDVFQLFRLMLPSKDDVRAPYGLKEDALAKAVLAGFGIDKKSNKGKAVLGWRKGVRGDGASATAGDVVGTLRDNVLSTELGGMEGAPEKVLTVGDVNRLLDELAATRGSEEDKGAVLTRLLKRCSAETGEWVLRIILRDLKAGISEASVFRAWHPAADKVWKTTSSLKRVCDDLKDPRVAGGNGSVELGAVAQPMFPKTFPSVGDLRSAASAVLTEMEARYAVRRPGAGGGGEGAGALTPAAWHTDVAAALAALADVADPPLPPGCSAHPPSPALDPSSAPPFYIERKFDGHRIQLHHGLKDDQGRALPTRFFSRSALDHAGGIMNFSVLAPALAAQLRPASIVLDGEMSVWRITRCKEEPFNLLRPAWSAAIDRDVEMGKVLAPEGKTGRDGEGEGEGEGGGGGGSGGGYRAGYRRGPGPNAAAEGAPMTADPDWSPPALSDLVLVYFAFDVLYLDAIGSTAHLPLPARKALLAAAVRRLPVGVVGVEVGEPHKAADPADPVAAAGGRTLGGGGPGPRLRMLGRVEPLLADEAFMCDAAGAPLGAVARACVSGLNADSIVTAYTRADERAEEGIVIKGAAAAWAPGERTGAWAKMKPEYEKAHEVDALLVGMRYGTGHRGGVASEYICALLNEKPSFANGVAQRPAAGEPRPRFATFVRVGTGFTIEEREQYHRALADVWEPVPHTDRNYFPAWLDHVGTHSEQADRWVADPTDPRIPVLVLKADVRVIRTSRYAAGLGLRAVRIARVHDGKSWADVALVSEFRAAIERSGGLLGRRHRAGTPGARGSTGTSGGRAAPGPRRLTRAIVPSHLRPDPALAPAAGVPLAGKRVHVITDQETGPYPTPAAAQAVVAALGGTWVALLVPDPTAQPVDFVVSPPRDSLGALARAVYDSAASGGGGKFPGRDILDVAWLAGLAGGRGGMDVDGGPPPPVLAAPAPRHYLHLARVGGRVNAPRAAGDIAAEGHALPCPGRWGDPARQDSLPDDMRAVLSRFMAGVALTRRDVLGEDGLAAYGGGDLDVVIGPGTPEADEAVAAGLAALAPGWPAGVARPDTTLRGCAVTAVALARPAPPPGPPAFAPASAHDHAARAAAAESRAAALTLKGLEVAVRGRGGRVVSAAGAWAGPGARPPPVTHLLVAWPPGLDRSAIPPPAMPLAILEAVRLAGGAAGLAALRAGLAAGTLTVVGEAWPEAAAAPGGPGGGGRGEAAHALPGAPPPGSGDAGWPWDQYGVAPPRLGGGGSGEAAAAAEAATAAARAGAQRRRAAARRGGAVQAALAPGGGVDAGRSRSRSPAVVAAAAAAAAARPSQATAALTAPAAAPPAVGLFASMVASALGGDSDDDGGGGGPAAGRRPAAPPPAPAAAPAAPAAAPLPPAAAPRRTGASLFDAMLGDDSDDDDGRGGPPRPPAGGGGGGGAGPPARPTPAQPTQAEIAAGVAAVLARPPPPPPPRPPSPPPPARLPSTAYADGSFAGDMLPEGWTRADFNALPESERHRLFFGGQDP